MDQGERSKNSSLDRDNEGRLTIVMNNPKQANPSGRKQVNPADRKRNKLIQFFPVSTASPKRRDKQEMEVKAPLKGFIGSAYQEQDRTGDCLESYAFFNDGTHYVFSIYNYKD